MTIPVPVQNVLAVVETVMLLMTLVFLTRGVKSRKNQSEHKGSFATAGVFFLAYLVLNVLRKWVFQF